jgi:hypothetical protein
MEKRFFSSPKHPDELWNPPRLLFNVYLGYFLVVNWLGQDVDHSPPQLLPQKHFDKLRSHTSPIIHKRNSSLMDGTSVS